MEKHWNEQKRITLKRQYRQFNELWWGDLLPDSCTVRWTKQIRAERSRHGIPIGSTHVHGMSICRPGCTGHIIEISEAIKPFTAYVDSTLIHEMVHLSAVLRGETMLNHGRYFQEEMKRLAAAGAFNDLW